MNGNKGFCRSLEQIPIAINSSYGDALQPNQWKNTLSKIEKLHNSGHKGEIMIGSKYIISKNQLDILSKNFPSIWLFYAITGLGESKIFSMQDYQKAYLSTCDKMKHVVCAIRPIIPDRNDKIEKLISIIEMVQKGRKLLTYTGYRDPEKPGSKKYNDPILFEEIENNCMIRDITVKTKCACIVAKVTNKLCVVHDFRKQPENLNLLSHLGYKFIVDEDKLILYANSSSKIITKGDLSFTRMITNYQTVSNNASPSEILSINLKNNKKLVCTSSWFNWAMQTKCEIGCDYCFANYNSKVRINLSDFGCSPVDILDEL